MQTGFGLKPSAYFLLHAKEGQLLLVRCLAGDPTYVFQEVIHNAVERANQIRSP